MGVTARGQYFGGAAGQPAAGDTRTMKLRQRATFGGVKDPSSDTPAARMAALLSMAVGLPFLDRGDVPPCSTVDPELYFPEPGTPGITAAKVTRELCASCQWRTPCLEWALERDEYGTWGGLNRNERSALRMKRLGEATA